MSLVTDMGLQMAGSLPSAIGNVVSTAIANRANRDIMREQAEFNASEAEKQRSWTREQWELQNAYNAPSAAVERLKEAGLNPALALSGLGQNGAAAGSGASASAGGTLSSMAAQFSPIDVSQLQLNKALADQAKANAEAKQHETIREDEKQPFALKNMLANWSLLQKQTDHLRSRIENLNVDSQLKLAQAVSVEKTWRNNERLINAQVDNLRSQSGLFKSQVKLNNREIWERTQTFLLRLQGLDLYNRDIQARIGLTEAQTQTEWFKQVLYTSEADYNNQSSLLSTYQSVLLGYDIDERRVHNMLDKQESADIEANPILRFLYLGGRVTGRVFSPLLNRFHVGVNSSSSRSTATVNSTSGGRPQSHVHNHLHTYRY